MSASAEVGMMLRSRVGLLLLTVAMVVCFVGATTTPLRPLVMRSEQVRGTVPADCADPTATVTTPPRIEVRDLPVAPAEPTAPPRTALRGRLEAVQTALERNDRAAFDSEFARVRTILDTYPRGAERTAAEDVVRIYEAAARLWDAQYASPFFSEESPEFALANAYPGYVEAVRRATFVDARGTRYYPAAESRAFLSRIAASRIGRIGTRVTAPRTTTSAPRTTTSAPRTTTDTPRATPPRATTPRTTNATTQPAPRRTTTARNTTTTTTSRKPAVTSPTPRSPNPSAPPTATAVPAPATPRASAPRSTAAPAPSSPAAGVTAVPPVPDAPAPATETSATPTDVAPTDVAPAESDTPSGTVATTDTTVPSTPIPTDTTSTDVVPSTDTTATSAAEPARGRSVIIPAILILIGLGVLIVLFRASK